ncbi:hypothetical protein UFOVP830_45 [uncultured Caudovirales phage]|uniref:Uncharacterized protein n=1 Tax=uncultured Caudovirales phage TaxID=2100421 RepID=A0A6J5P3G7_9CAUD|nr:hypothetical protein UFOVP830_45 [uncultured Caudovirales phage]
MIIQTISTASQFRDQFVRMGRKDQFSYQALGLLFDYFDECGDNVELDVIGICCEFTEMDAGEVRYSYRLDADTDVEQYLNDNTLLIGKTDAGAYVFAQF